VTADSFVTGSIQFVARPVTSAPSDAESRQRSGVLYAVGAYALWGGIPLYFLLLAPAGGVEIVAWRILFSLVFCALLLTVTRKWSVFAAVVRQPRLMLATGLAGVLIYANWQLYVVGVLNGQIVEAALGYFINPIVTVLLGVLFLRERLRPLQWVAVGVSTGAILVLLLGLGSVPWLALGLALSFGLYGLIKKRAGVSLDAVTGLTLETLWLVPVASVILIIVASTTGIVIGTVSPAHTVLMMCAGIVTAVPLLLFASAARRLSLVGLGLIQYLTPTLQFLLGVFIMREAMPVERWIGFTLVWVALVILTWDLIAHGRAARRSLPLPA
jgi:chloramphenicol-sensitive protein RarD